MTGVELYLLGAPARTIINRLMNRLCEQFGILQAKPASTKTGSKVEEQIYALHDAIAGVVIMQQREYLAHLEACLRSLRDSGEASDEEKPHFLRRAITEANPLIRHFSRTGKTAGYENRQLLATTCLALAAANGALKQKRLFARYISQSIDADEDTARSYLRDGKTDLLAELTAAVNATGRQTRLNPPKRPITTGRQTRLNAPNRPISDANPATTVSKNNVSTRSDEDIDSVFPYIHDDLKPKNVTPAKMVTSQAPVPTPDPPQSPAKEFFAWVRIAAFFLACFIALWFVFWFIVGAVNEGVRTITGQ